MMHFDTMFDVLARQAAPVAVTGLWQGLAIAVVLALWLKLATRIAAAQRFVLWSVAFLAVSALPLVPLLIPSSHPSAVSGMTASLHTWFQLDARWTLVLAALWLVASAARAADLVFHSIRLRRLWRTAKPVEVPALPDSQRAFQVCATQFIDRPSVIGFFAPRVLIPDWLLPRLTPDELRQIVLHETTHLGRRDDWTNFVQKLCLVFFPLNPGLWWIDRQLGKEREMACDEAVVRITQAPRAYAACLTSLAERGIAHRREALSLGAWQHRSELVSRVHRILQAHRGLSPAAARLLLGAFGCGLFVLTFELARCPQLVAFVPAAETAHAAPALATSAQLGDAVYPANPRRAVLMPGVHMVETRAVMPAAFIAKPSARRAQAKIRAEGELRAVSSEPGIDSREISVRDRAGSSIATEVPQQFIVFTAWEQIETVPAESQTTIADYDTQPDASSQAPGTTPATNLPQSSAARPTQNPIAHRATVTQLIFRIAPTDSNTPQPIAIPLGWFVIQL